MLKSETGRLDVCRHAHHITVHAEMTKAPVFAMATVDQFLLAHTVDADRSTLTVAGYRGTRHVC